MPKENSYTIIPAHIEAEQMFQLLLEMPAGEYLKLVSYVVQSIRGE